MQLFSLIIRFAKFTDPIRDVTDIRHPDCRIQRGYADRVWGCYWHHLVFICFVTQNPTLSTADILSDFGGKKTLVC